MEEPNPDPQPNTAKWSTSNQKLRVRQWECMLVWSHIFFFLILSHKKQPCLIIFHLLRKASYTSLGD